MSGLFIGHFEVGKRIGYFIRLLWGGEEGWVKCPSCVKLVRIILETLNLVRKYTHICSARTIYLLLFSTKALLILLMSAVFSKKSAFLAKIVLLLKAVVWEFKNFLALFSVFVIEKVAINENKSFTQYASRIWLLDCSKLAINWKNDTDATLFQNKVMVNFFCLFVPVVSFSYWSYEFSLVIELRQFSFIRDWQEIQKLEIPRSQFRPISGHLARYQGSNFYRFWVIKGKPTGGGGVKLSPHPD